MGSSTISDLYKPFSAGPFDRVVGWDERGEPVHRTVTGHTYWSGSPPESQSPEPPRTRIENRADAQGRVSHYRVPDPVPNSAKAVRSFADTIVAGFTAPGRAARGEPVTLGDTLGTSISTGSLAAPMRAPKGALRMFAGRNARTADLGALARAEALSQQGLDAGSIYRDTGWFKSADGQWRFEIDDSAASVRPFSESLSAHVRDNPGTEFYAGTLADQFHHPDLYAAYPGAAGIPVYAGQMPKSFGAAVMEVDPMHPAGPFGVTLNTAADDDLPSLVHELQHVIQEAEGFSPGAAVPTQLRPGTPEWQVYQSQIAQAPDYMPLEDFAKGAGVTPEEARAGYEMYVRPESWTAAQDREARELALQSSYIRSMGETEARNVETRLSLSQAQRRQTPPWKTQDIPTAKQLHSSHAANVDEIRDYLLQALTGEGGPR